MIYSEKEFNLLKKNYEDKLKRLQKEKESSFIFIKNHYLVTFYVFILDFLLKINNFYSIISLI